MTARSLAAVLVVVAAGVLIGSGLAALAQAPPNDPCADFGTLPEGSSSSGSLELSGAGWQSAGFNVALSISVLVGAPLAFVVDHLLRPRNTRSVGGSLRVALAIAALMFCAVFATILEPRAAIAFGVLASALTSMRLTRSPVATT
jgi:hypothetical protein